jgi:Transposase IS66 family
VIKGCRRYLFIFLANRAIPPTNNGSERGLRPCVVFRKVTNHMGAINSPLNAVRAQSWLM